MFDGEGPDLIMWTPGVPEGRYRADGIYAGKGTNL